MLLGTKINPKVAIVAIAKDEDISIKEWVIYHLKLGFDDIILFQNDWDCQYRNNRLKLYSANGSNRQLACYNHFICDMASEYDWVAFIDLDEFIVLKKHTNIKRFIEVYGNQWSICMNWVYFGSGNQHSITSNSVLKRFTRRSHVPDIHIKTLLNLESGALMLDPHHASIPSIDTNWNKVSGPFNPGGPIDVVQINHYYHKSYQEWRMKCKRGRADGDWPRNFGEWEACVDKNLEVEDNIAVSFLYDQSDTQN